jgi:fluoride ion exporter CrcB/FEX
MGIGISVVVGAIGAILRYALTGPINQQGFNLHTGGVILMFVGALGLVLSMLFWSSFAPFGRGRSMSRREEVTSRNGQEQDHVVRETREVAN